MRGPKVRGLECGSVATAFANGGASAGQAYSARRRRQAAALQGGLRPQMSKLQGKPLAFREAVEPRDSILFLFLAVGPERG